MAYITLKEEITTTIEIEKSKFIASIKRIENSKEAEEFINKIKKLHYKATHNCSAYVLNNPSYQKCSDDGEPSGTAGVPILDCLKKNGLENVCCVVTRYFGGIKLGAGGLIRAYSNSTSNSIKNAKLLKVQEYPHYQIEFSYDLINVIEKYFAQNQIKVINKEYDVNVSYLFFTDIIDVEASLNNLTLGKIKFLNHYNSFIEEEI